MANQSNGKDFADIAHVRRFEAGLKKEGSSYFDVGELELIIDYYISKNNALKARKALKFGKKLHPTESILDKKHVQLLFIERRLKKAENLLEKLTASGTDDFELLWLYGSLFLEKKEYDTASRYLKRMVLQTGNEDKMFAFAGIIMNRAGAYEQSRYFLKKGLNGNEDTKLLYYELAYSYEKTGDFVKSEQFYEKYLEKTKKSANVWYNYGVVSEKNGKPEQALKAYQQALNIKPNHNAALYNSAVLQNKEGNYEAAINLYRNVQDAEPENLQISLQLADCLKNAERYDEAEHLYKSVKEKHEVKAEALYGIASVFALQDKLNKASNYALMATRADEKNSEYNYLAGLLHFKLKKYDKAEIFLRIAIRNDLEMEKAWLLYSDLLEIIKPDRKLSFLQTASKALPENAAISYRIAEEYYRQKETDKFLQYFELGLKQNPEGITGLIRRCPDLSSNKKVESYIKHYS